MGTAAPRCETWGVRRTIRAGEIAGVIGPAADRSRRSLVRRSRAVTAALGLALIIQACSPGTASPSASSAPSAEAPSAPAASPSAAAAPVELTLLEHQKPRQEVLAKIIPMCESSLAAAGLNVKVNLTGDVVEDEQFRQNVTILYQGDNP